MIAPLLPAGPSAVSALIAAALALLWLAGCGLAALRGRSVPLVAWLAGPVALPTLSGLGAWWTLTQGVQQLPTATPVVRPALAATGLGEGLQLLSWGWAIGAALAVLGCWAASLATLRGEPTDSWQPVRSLGLAGAVVCVIASSAAVSAWMQVPPFPALTLALIALPVALSVLRSSEVGVRQRSVQVAAVMLLATWAVLAIGAASFVGEWALAASAVAKASMATKHALLTQGVGIGLQTSIASSTSGPLLGLVCGVAWLTWARQGQAPSSRIRFALGGVLLLPLLVALPPVVPASALWHATLDGLGFPPSDDLQLPTAPQVTDATAPQGMHLALSRRDLVLNGEWVFDLDRTQAPSGDGWVPVLPGADRPGHWARLGKRLGRIGHPDVPLLLQVDRRIPWSVLGPVLHEVRAAGFHQLELQAMDADRLGVVLLEPDWPLSPVPDDALEALLTP